MFGLSTVRAYLAAGLLTALAISSAVNYAQHRANAALERARVDLATKLRAAIEANESQATALGTLEHANGELLAACTASESARTLATEAARFRANVAAAATRIENAGSKDYGSPKCAEVLALDVAGACPAIARGLLERAGRRASADGASTGARDSASTD